MNILKVTNQKGKIVLINKDNITAIYECAKDKNTSFIEVIGIDNYIIVNKPITFFEDVFINNF